ncbi:hypothetical protein DXG01_012659 [Tephrocybe rancida]|nr:hypothetical protein DXG01_012659 [Tephrocybe rancida]
MHPYQYYYPAEGYDAQAPANRQPPVDNHLAMSAFLLGMGPPPPPRPEEIAVARLNAAMNSGAFDPAAQQPHAQASGMRNRDTPPPPSVPAQTLEVRIPVPREGGGQPTIVPIKISSSIEPRDFFSRIIVNSDLDVATACLGWKSCDDTKTSNPRRLKTDDDVHFAFNELLGLMGNTRQRRPVYMDIINLTTPPTPAPVAPKLTETAVSEEMKIVKEKLRHHTPLGIAELLLWAREMRDGRCDRECKLAPEILRLDDLVDAERERLDRGARRYGSRQPAMPEIHVHLADSLVGEILVPEQCNPVTPKRKRHDDPSDEDDEDDSPIIAISDLLQSLHTKRPALEYPQYEGALLKAGIAYANAVLEFDKAFFTSEEVGMPKGAVGDFFRAAKSAVKKSKHERKKA